MALEKKELLKLMKLAATADKNSPTAYSWGEEQFTATDLNAAVRAELQGLAGNIQDYRRNKNLIFELIENTIDEVLPKRVLEAYGQFAEVQTVAQGDKPVFRLRITNASRKRAKQFITKVGLAGIYEVFKLDGTSATIDVMAYGGAAQIGLEEFLDGRITFADVLEIVLEGLDEAVYRQIAASLLAATDGLSVNNAANLWSGSSFDASKMDGLLAIADSYGQASIYCTYEFAATMLPADAWASDQMKNDRWHVGYIQNYKGHQVVILPQSFEDETNAVKVFDPEYAYIIPAGAEKPVKIVFEGQTIAREYENKDGSREIHVYKKIGVATHVSTGICRYRNTSL